MRAYYLLDYINLTGWARMAPPANGDGCGDAGTHRYDFTVPAFIRWHCRYLRHRMANYDYERHFGGVIYLFCAGWMATSAAGYFAPLVRRR